MSEEFIIEEEESTGRSPFALLAAALVGLLVLAVLCIAGASLLQQNGDGVSATSTVIAQINQTTEAQNAFVTQTLIAMAATETQEALATDTPTPTPTVPTSTPSPTWTPKPTETPVVQPPGDTPTPNLAGTSIFGGTSTFNATPTVIGGSGGTGGTGGTGGAGGTGGTGTLPQTGVGLWGAIGAAVILVAVLIIARRLRTG
jgi:hypothetical protein